MRMLRVLWKGWSSLARKIGYVQSLLILTIIYFVLVAPFALAVRLFVDPLRVRGPSSWHRLPREAGSITNLTDARQQS
jgi:saxitoxin biosynthesis operon SxtJ-like protein